MNSRRLLFSLCLALLFTAPSAGADTDGLAKLRKSFESQISTMRGKLQRAARMKYLNVALGSPITVEQCLQISQKISGNYKVNPFHVDYQGGQSDSLDCSDGALDNYFQAIEVRTNFNLQTRYALQVDRNFSDSEILRTILLDSSFRILEIDDYEAVIAGGKKIPFAYCVAAIDHEGNNFRGYFKEPGYENLGTEFQYSSADGKIPLITEAAYPSSADSKTTIHQIIYEKTDGADWTNFALLLTHSWNLGGFYTYGDQLFHRPNNMDQLTLYSVDGKETCASGMQVRNFTQPNRTVMEWPDPNTYSQCDKTWGSSGQLAFTLH